jgi:hypothetical protein
VPFIFERLIKILNFTLKDCPQEYLSQFRDCSKVCPLQKQRNMTFLKEFNTSV